MYLICLLIHIDNSVNEESISLHIQRENLPLFYLGKQAIYSSISARDTFHESWRVCTFMNGSWKVYTFVYNTHVLYIIYYDNITKICDYLYSDIMLQRCIITNSRRHRLNKKKKVKV